MVGDTLGVELPHALPVTPSLLRVTLGVTIIDDDREVEVVGLRKGVRVAPLKDTVGRVVGESEAAGLAVEVGGKGVGVVCGVGEDTLLPEAPREPVTLELAGTLREGEGERALDREANTLPVAATLPVVEREGREVKEGEAVAVVVVPVEGVAALVKVCGPEGLVTPLSDPEMVTDGLMVEDLVKTPVTLGRGEAESVKPPVQVGEEVSDTVVVTVPPLDREGRVENDTVGEAEGVSMPLFEGVDVGLVTGLQLEHVVEDGKEEGDTEVEAEEAAVCVAFELPLLPPLPLLCIDREGVVVADTQRVASGVVERVVREDREEEGEGAVLLDTVVGEGEGQVVELGEDTWVREREGEMEGEEEGEAEVFTDLEGRGEEDPLGLSGGVGDTDTLPEAQGIGVVEEDGVPPPETVTIEVELALLWLLPVKVVLGEPVGEGVLRAYVPLEEAVPPGVVLPRGLPEPVLDTLSEEDTEGELKGDREALPLEEGVEEMEGDTESLPVKVPPTESVGEAVDTVVRVGVGKEVGEPLKVAPEDTVEVREEEADTVEVGEGEGSQLTEEVGVKGVVGDAEAEGGTEKES